MKSLIQLIEKLVSFLPRIAFVYPNEGGVFLRLGRYKKTICSGWYFLLPYIDQVDKLDITTQVINLPNQSIITKDSQVVAVSGAIEYSINDARKALLCIQDYDISLQNLAMGTIAHYLNRKDYVECTDIGGLEAEVLKALRKRVQDWGLYITKFWITDFAKHKVYRLMLKDVPLGIPIDDTE